MVSYDACRQTSLCLSWGPQGPMVFSPSSRWESPWGLWENTDALSQWCAGQY